MLVTTMRVDTAPARPLTLSARSGTASASVPLADLAAPGAWRTYGVPLKCFADQGVDMEHLDVPFALTTPAKAVISLATVQLDRTGVGQGKSVAVRVHHGGPRTIKKKK